jgi:hypothetical protein
MRRKKMMGMTEEECMKEFDRISADCPKMQFNLDVVLATQYLWAELLLEGLDIEYASVIKARIIHIRNQLRLFERQAVPDTNIDECHLIVHGKEKDNLFLYQKWNVEFSLSYALVKMYVVKKYARVFWKYIHVILLWKSWNELLEA